MKSPSPLSRRRVLGGSLATGLAALLTVSARSQAGPPAADLRLLTVRDSGFDGTVPGPALQVRRGEEVRLRVVNQMAEPTAVHWHGVRLANAMDGTPPLTQAPIAPGQGFDCRFVAPDAGTYWYHPVGQTPGSLYGALVVSETENIDVDRDLTLIFATPKQPAAGGGPPITVNGAANFEIRTQANARLRLRVINASASDMLGLRIKGLPAFVMAIDGQPAEPFAARDGRLSLGPGNRIDAFVDCTLAPGATAPILVERKTGDVPIVSIVCDQGAAQSAPARSETVACQSAARTDGLCRRPSFRLGYRPGFGDAAEQSAVHRQTRTNCDRWDFPIQHQKTVISTCMDTVFVFSMRLMTAGNHSGSIRCRSNRGANLVSPSLPTIPAIGRSRASLSIRNSGSK